MLKWCWVLEVLVDIEAIRLGSNNCSLLTKERLIKAQCDLPQVFLGKVVIYRALRWRALPEKLHPWAGPWGRALWALAWEDQLTIL